MNEILSTRYKMITVRMLNNCKKSVVIGIVFCTKNTLRGNRCVCFGMLQIVWFDCLKVPTMFRLMMLTTQPHAVYRKMLSIKQYCGCCSNDHMCQHYSTQWIRKFQKHINWTWNPVELDVHICSRKI